MMKIINYKFYIYIILFLLLPISSYADIIKSLPNGLEIITDELHIIIEEHTITHLENRLTNEIYSDNGTIYPNTLLHNNKNKGIKYDKVEIIINNLTGKIITSNNIMSCTTIVKIDSANDKIIISQMGNSKLKGVSGCRWNLSGLHNDIDIILPAYGGVKILAGEYHINYPDDWESALTILESEKGCISIMPNDYSFTYKRHCGNICS